jgi:hypothetical protein
MLRPKRRLTTAGKFWVVYVLLLVLGAYALVEFVARRFA